MQNKNKKSQLEICKRRERLEAIKELMVTINHEIRNPLAALSLAAQQLQKEREQLNRKIRDYLDIITESEQQIEAVLEDLNMISEPASVEYIGETKMLALKGDAF